MYEQEILNSHEIRKKNPWMREEIEEIVKEEKIDRTRFHEFSKRNYKQIIRKFYFSFSDRENFTPSRIFLDYSYMHIRKDFERKHIDCFFRTYNWTEYMMAIKNAVPDKNLKLFLILDEGWVYGGYADEIFHVMDNTCCNYDFYIVSSKFDWFIAVSNIEDNAVLFRKKMD